MLICVHRSCCSRIIYIGPDPDNICLEPCTVVLFTIFCILLLVSILRVLALKLSRLKADVVRVRADINNPCSAWGSMVRGAFRLRENDCRSDKDRGRIRIRKEIRQERLKAKCGQEGCPRFAQFGRYGKYCANCAKDTMMLGATTKKREDKRKKTLTPRPAKPNQLFDANPTLSVEDYMERLCPPLQDTTQMPRDLTWEAIDSGYADCGSFPNYRDRQQREEFMDWLQSGSVFAEHHEQFFHQPAPDLDHFIRHAFLEAKLRRIRRCVIAGLDAQRKARAAAAVDVD